jgi:hypothetical protein
MNAQEDRRKRSNRKRIVPTNFETLAWAGLLNDNIARKENDDLYEKNVIPTTAFPCNPSNEQSVVMARGKFGQCDTKSGKDKFTACAEFRTRKAMAQLFRGSKVIAFHPPTHPFLLLSTMLLNMNSSIGTITFTESKIKNRVANTTIYGSIEKPYLEKLLKEGHAYKERKNWSRARCLEREHSPCTLTRPEFRYGERQKESTNLLLTRVEMV